MRELLNLIGSARIYDLGQPYFTGMPHYPTHPPFLFSLTHEHPAAAAFGSASDAIAMSGHTGTHMDALCHFSRGGRLHDGTAVAGAQSFTGGVRTLSIDTVAPVFRRGILLDIAGLLGVESLAEHLLITPEHLERAAESAGVHPETGDVVLLRTGWARFWDDPVRYHSGGRAPGPGEEGGRWLSSRRIFAAGADTLSFEKVPDPAMPVHIHLLVECGIHLFECLNLEALARDRVHEFLFVALPLKIRGGTASPVRPAAVVPEI